MTTPTAQPLAWDPKCPAALLTATGDEQGLRVDKFLADDGVGCNKYERSACMKIIAAQREYFSGTRENPKALCREYLSALNECLDEWKKDTSLTDDGSSVEALEVVYAITQLSDIYLLMPTASDDTIEGAVTADTIRYLRLHQMSDPLEVVGEGLDEMLESMQPEKYGASYWKLLQKLVVRGCLDDAWKLITAHSYFRRCYDDQNMEALDDDPYHAVIMKQDKQGFAALRALLLSAPLPGGRSAWNDSGLDSTDENTQERDDTTLLLDGVPRDAYKLWDPQWSVEDGPLMFNPHAAMDTIKIWKGAVAEHAALHGLVSRIPQLQTNVLDILYGKLDGVDFESWSEALCAELLYQKPSLRPKDMHVRAKDIMKKRAELEGSGTNEVVLGVMDGNAGRALEALYNLGGSSGAALPATMTSLLCNLLVEAGQIPQSDDLSFSFQTELLLSASEALLSSLSSSEEGLGVRLSTELLLPFTKPSGDVRVVATLGETLERHGPSSNPEARALLELCRDLVARKSRRVLDGCVNLILYRYRHYLSNNNYAAATHWLLKGLELEVLFYATSPDGRRDEKAWEIVNASGVFGTLLCSSCLTLSKSLLFDLVGTDEETTMAGLDFARVRDMVESMKVDDPSELAHKISDMRLLNLVFKMATAITEEKDDSIVASKIVECLQETKDMDNNGVIASVAHSALFRDLLWLAHNILKRDESRVNDSETGKQKSVSSFDVQGIQVLQKTFIEVGNGKGREDESTMRLALGKGLERAIVAENAKRQQSGTTKPTGRLGSAKSSNLSAYTPSQQEEIVKNMLMPSMY